MDMEKIIATEKEVYSNTFSRLPVAIVRGEGMYVYDVNGKKYLDMFAGIAVNCLGHSHPRMVDAINEQAKTLIHISNWFYTLPQLELCKKLVELTGLKKAFLTNDGSEAVEAAIKLARKTTGKKEIIAADHAFHGRTLGALSLTGTDKYKKPFEPLVPGVKFVRYNDIADLEKNLTSDTAAVILEPIQGEAGVIVPDSDYLKAARELTQVNDCLLILDEVQTGFGRTGKMFAFQHSDVKPDILCLAKGLGGGFPIGAIVFDCDDFSPGDHGGTFVGNPLAAHTADAVINTLIDEKLADNAEEIGNYLRSEFASRGFSVRGKGLMIGVEVDDGSRCVRSLIENGVLAIHSGNTLRILPPLIIQKTHADEFLSAFDSIDL